MKIGIPTQKNRAVFRQRVTGLNAISNVKTLKQGRVEAGGNVEFWPNRYGPHNGSDISGRLFPVRARSTSAGSLGGYVDATVDSVRGCFRT